MTQETNQPPSPLSAVNVTSKYQKYTTVYQYPAKPYKIRNFADFRERLLYILEI